MSLLSDFNIGLTQLDLYYQASVAAYSVPDVPAGWTVVTPQQLGVPPQYWNGSFYYDTGASAIVLKQGNEWIVSFRGADEAIDFEHYKTIDLFRPLLAALAASVPGGDHISFTGSSLGGAATNLVAEIAATEYDGKFADATFVAFASLIISENRVLRYVLGGGCGRDRYASAC
jgi:hypothetical protein